MKRRIVSGLLACSLLFALSLTSFSQAFLMVAQAAGDEAVIIDVTDFGADPSGYADSAQAIEAAVEASKSVDGPVVINFPTGEYHIYPDRAPKRELYISNTVGADQSYNMKTIGILLENMQDVVIEGNGSLLMYHGKMMALAAIDSENVTFQNFSYDFQVPTVIDLTVETLGSEDGQDYGVFYVPECYNYAINGTSIQWLSDQSPYTGETYWSYTNSANYTQIHDWKSGETWRASNPVFSNVSSIEDMGNNRIKINYSNRNSSIQEGYCYQMRSTVRDHASAFFWQSKDVTMRNMNTYFLHGFGIVGQFSENITIDNVNFEVPEGSGRTTAGYADFIQMSGCKGLISIKDSNFKNAHDDPINIHGTFLQVVERIADNKFRVQYRHNETAGFPNFYVGDEVEFMTRGNMVPVENSVAKVVEVEGPTKSNLTDIIITLDKDMPNEVGSNTHVVENITYTPSVEIRNNVFAAIPTRGILVTTRQPIVIEDNYFDSMGMAGIYISNDAQGWYESGPVRDVTIRNNVFDKCGSPVIYFDPTNSAVDAENPVHQNVLIENNTFNIKNGNVLGVKSVENLQFINNTINRYDRNVSIALDAETTQLQVGEGAALEVESGGNALGSDLYWFNGCKNITMAGNTYDGGLKMNATTSNMPETYLDWDEEEGVAVNGAARHADPVGTIGYISTNESVLAVTKDGSVLAAGEGTADVVAYSILNGKLFESNAVTFTVEGASSKVLPEVVTISGGADKLTEKGQTAVFEAAVVPGDADGTVAWSVVDAATGEYTGSASIDQDGVLTAISDGVVEVIARTANNLQDSKLVSIILPPGQDDQLAGNWSLIRQANAHWNFVSGEDAVVIRAQGGSLWSTGNSVNNIILSEFSGEKEIVTATLKVSGKTKSSYDEAGLIFYAGDDDYVTVQRKHNNGNPTINVVNETGGNPNEDGGKADISSEDIYYKLVKSGNTLTGYYSEDGTSWTEIRSVTNATLGGDFKIGVIAAGGSATNTPFVFSGLEINGEAVGFRDSNRAPSASNVQYTADTAVEGAAIGVSYDFTDIDGDEEGDSIIRWMTADDENGYYRLVDGLVGNNAIVPAGLAGQHLKAIVIPVDQYGKAGEIAIAEESIPIMEGKVQAGLSQMEVVSGLPLNPVFHGDTTEYTLDIPYMVQAVSLKLAANASNQAITVLADGQQIANDTGSVLVNVDIHSAKELTITVEDDESVVKTYTIALNLLKSSQAGLSSAYFSGIDFGTFVKSSRYSISSVGADMDTVEMKLTAENSDARIAVTVNNEKVAGEELGNAERQIHLMSGANEIEVRVTAPDGSSFMYYRFIIIRTGDGNTALSALTVNGEAVPAFDARETEYTLNVNQEGTVQIGAVAQSGKASVAVTSGANRTEGGNAEVSLSKGLNRIVVTVKAETFAANRYYVLNIIVDSPDNADLLSLDIDGIRLTPIFDTDTLAYTASASAETVTVSAAAQDSNAIVRVSCNVQLISGEKEVTAKLNVYDGANTIYVVVESADGSVEKEYRIDLNVANTTYVSDYPIAEQRYGYQPMVPDKNPNGETIRLYQEDGTVQLYEKGLGAHASSTLIYDIEGEGFDSFQSWIGLDYSQFNASYGDVRFIVKVNDETVFTSEIMYQKTPAVLINIPLDEDSKTIELTVDEVTNNYNDHAIWADAKFTGSTLTAPAFTAQDVADALSVQEPGKDDTMLRIPDVPRDYSVTITKSSHPTVVATDGTIVPPVTGMTVTLTFTVTNNHDDSDIGTRDIQVYIPEATKPLNTKILQYTVDYAKRAAEEGGVDQLIPRVKEAFENALEKAEEVLEDALSSAPGVTQEEVDKAAENLLEMIHLLEFKAVDKSELARLIAVAEKYENSESEYIAATFIPFKEALESARAVIADEDLMDAAVVETAWENLLDAIVGLRMKPDKSKLESLLKQAKMYDLSLYTIETVRELSYAASEAETIMTDETVEQKEVNASVSRVQKAIEELELLPASAKSDPSSKTDGADGVKGFNSSGSNNPKTGDSLPFGWGLLFAAAIITFGLFKRAVKTVQDK